MKLERLPDWVLNDICSITPEWLQKRNLKGVLADLDNTLAKYGQKEPSEKISEWIFNLRKTGIPLAVISNNKEKRVSCFCEQFRLEHSFRARKPDPGALLHMAARLGLQPHETAMIGDQIFTDVVAAKRAGMVAVIVPPLSNNPFFALRRRFERKYIYRSIELRKEL